MNDTVTLIARYAPGAALAGEPPMRYIVTARDGALHAELLDLPTALRWFVRWANPESEAP